MKTWSKGVLAAAGAALLWSGGASADDVGGGSVAQPLLVLAWLMFTFKGLPFLELAAREIDSGEG